MFAYLYYSYLLSQAVSPNEVVEALSTLGDSALHISRRGCSGSHVSGSEFYLTVAISVLRGGSRHWRPLHIAFHDMQFDAKVVDNHLELSLPPSSTFDDNHTTQQFGRAVTEVWAIIEKQVGVRPEMGPFPVIPQTLTAADCARGLLFGFPPPPVDKRALNFFLPINGGTMPGGEPIFNACEEVRCQEGGFVLPLILNNANFRETFEMGRFTGMVSFDSVSWTRFGASKILVSNLAYQKKR